MFLIVPTQYLVPSVLWRCWFGGRKGIWPVKNREVGCWHGCLGRGADLHMAQRIPLPFTVSCFSKIQIGFAFLVLAHWVVSDKGPLNGCCCCCSCPMQYLLKSQNSYENKIFQHNEGFGNNIPYKSLFPGWWLQADGQQWNPDCTVTIYHLYQWH